MNKKGIATKRVVTKKQSWGKNAVKKHKVRIGAKAPAFHMESTSGEVLTSLGLQGTRYVLYFYPKDMTSGCTVEAQEFSALAKKFAKTGVQVFGVSPDDIASHQKFIAKEKITFPLLADTAHKVAEKFGVWVEKSMYGRKYMGINRSTFVVGADGKIEAIYRDVKPEGHAVCVLSDIGAK